MSWGYEPPLPVEVKSLIEPVKTKRPVIECELSYDCGSPNFGGEGVFIVIINNVTGELERIQLTSGQLARVAHVLVE